MSFQGRACWGARRGDDERAFPSHYSIQQEALGGLALLSIINTRGGGGGGEARTSAGAEGFNERCLKKHENVSVKLLSLCRGSADLRCFPLSRREAAHFTQDSLQQINIRLASHHRRLKSSRLTQTVT